MWIATYENARGNVEERRILAADKDKAIDAAQILGGEDASLMGHRFMKVKKRDRW